MRSLPQNISSPTTKLGTPKMPRATPRSVLSISACRISASGRRLEGCGVHPQRRHDRSQACIVCDRRIVALPVGRKDRVDERHLEPPAAHRQRTAQDAARLDRNTARKAKGQVVFFGPARQVALAVGELGRRLLEHHVVVLPEHVAEVVRVQHQCRASARENRAHQLQREVGVSAADVPVQVPVFVAVRSWGMSEGRSRSRCSNGVPGLRRD